MAKRHASGTKTENKEKCLLQRKNWLQICEGCSNNNLIKNVNILYGKELKMNHHKEHCVFIPFCKILLKFSSDLS